jgi:hypothetical protein
LVIRANNARNLERDRNDELTSFRLKRSWEETTDTGKLPNFSKKEQLKNVQKEFKAYDNQSIKFKKIVVDINKGKEKFFPNESESLFNEYIDVIEILKKNLNSIKEELKKK